MLLIKEYLAQLYIYKYIINAIAKRQVRE